MSDHGAGVAYRLWCEDTRDWTPTEGRIKANNAIAELEHELVGLGETLAIAIGEKLNQEHMKIAAEDALAKARKIATVEADNCFTAEAHANNLQVELERRGLKLIFIEEWFDNILPQDWEMCMKRWEDR